MTSPVTPAAGDPGRVERCLAGEPGAWADLVRSYGPLVWTVARRAGLSDDDVAEVYQITWRVVVQDLGRLRDPERLGLWIGRIAHFQSMRMLRGHFSTRRALARIPPKESDGRKPDEELQRLEDRRRVQAAVERLGDRCRRLLEELYYRDPTPSYEAVSLRLDMPVGSIGPTRARCLEKLARELGGLEP